MTMTDLERVAAYLRGQLWPKQEGYEYSPAMAADIDRRCRELAAGVLAELGRSA